MGNILISCITPTFNRAQLLKKAIESTIAQTYPNWEMIIVDDGSNDNTEEVATECVMQDERIKYFKNPGKGANAARNFGIRQAQGEWIAFLDDDVENVPERFEKQLWAANKTNSNFIVSGFNSFTKEGKLKSYTKGWWATGAPMTSCWFIKKDLLIKAGLFDETMRAMQDAELSYRIAKYETFVNLLHPLTIEKNTVGSTSKGLNGIRGKEILIEKHKNNMPPLEAAWWYFVIGMGYYTERDDLNALKNLSIAAEFDERGIYKLAYHYAKIFFRFGKVLKKINARFLNILSGYKFPKLIKHNTVR